MNDITKNIREELLRKQDIKYRDFHKSLCTTSNLQIIGVRTPEIRKIAKRLISEDYEKFFYDEDIVYYEELLLKGFLIGSLKISIEKIFEYLRYFIPKIDNWAICDGTCASLKITSKNMDKMWNFLQEYIKSKKEYEVRFALVMYLDYFMDKKYVEKIFEQIESIKNEEYYVKMAVAWLISEAFVKESTLALDFMKKTNIDKWTYNKSIQKIVESYRVSEEDKILLKSMKK